MVKNDLVDGANDFDEAKVKADADGFALSDDYKAVDVEAIRGALGRRVLATRWQTRAPPCPCGEAVAAKRGGRFALPTTAPRKRVA